MKEMELGELLETHKCKEKLTSHALVPDQIRLSFSWHGSAAVGRPFGGIYPWQMTVKSN